MVTCNCRAKEPGHFEAGQKEKSEGAGFAGRGGQPKAEQFSADAEQGPDQVLPELLEY